jgi:AraC family transcriptional regulator of adaptative response/methylated-DNA-[protein]-cysteine methyltransferase
MMQVIPRSDPRDAERWLAVLRRDQTADRSFVYAVRSTGIYCRPSCPSRRPSREQVEFHPSPAEAERAGYRACRRCRPKDEIGGDGWPEKVRKAAVFLASQDGHVTLLALSRRVGGSPHHLQRIFRRIVGVTPREYAEACRLAKVKGRLRNGSDVTAAIMEAGYGSIGRFYERGAPKLGMKPSTYREGGVAETVKYAIVGCSLGRLMVARTARGVCAVSMGSSDSSLQRALRDEFPRATVVADPGALGGLVDKVLDHIAGREPRLDLPLDVRATAFQWQVWTALARIPYGETRSYGDLAAAIGRPGAARAVARACATNPVALAIPCHRAIPTVGGTGGYRWGRARKRALLDRERSGS